MTAPRSFAKTATAITDEIRAIDGRLVVDATVAVKWYLPEEGDTAALAVLASGMRLLAPDLIQVEVTNVLRSKARQGELSPARAATTLDAFLTGGAVEIRPSSGLLRDALAIAGELDHSVYDALYLALARSEGCQVVTSDRRLMLKTRGTPYESLVQSLT